MLYTERPGDDFGIDLIRNEAAGRRTRVGLRGRRNVDLQKTTAGQEAHAGAHHAGAPGSEQVIAGFCSVCSCGGRVLVAKLLGITS